MGWKFEHSEQDIPENAARATQEALLTLRQEEVLKEINDEGLKLKLMLARLKTTTRLQLLKQQRAHDRAILEADRRRLQDEMLLEEMGSNRRQNELLRRKLIETQRSLSK